MPKLKTSELPIPTLSTRSCALTFALVQRELAVSDLDLILATTSRYDAYDNTIFNGIVTDGNLDLDFVPKVENPKISAFVVYKK